MSSSKATPVELADMFCSSDYGVDLTVSVGLDDDPPVVYEQGKWHLIVKRLPDGTMHLDDITVVEVRSEVMAFLREIDAEVTSARVTEVERLARLVCLQKGVRRAGASTPSVPADVTPEPEFPGPSEPYHDPLYGPMTTTDLLMPEAWKMFEGPWKAEGEA